MALIVGPWPAGMVDQYMENRLFAIGFRRCWAIRSEAGQFIMDGLNPAGSDISEADRTFIEGQIAGAVADSQAAAQEKDNEAASKRRLGGAAANLQSWANDAAGVVAQWDGSTPAQKDAALKVVIQRFGILCNRIDDILIAGGL